MSGGDTGKLKILMLTKGVPWQIGGGGEFVYLFRLGEQLARRGHKVKILAVLPRGVQPHSLPWAQSIRYIAEKRIPSRAELSRLMRLEAESMIKEFKPDIVHANGGEAADTLRYCRKQGVVTVAVQHFNPQPRSWLLASRWRKAERSYVRNATAVVTPSHYTADRTAEVYGIPKKRITVVPGGYDPRMLEVRAMRAKRITDKTQPAEILVIGRIGPGKGSDVLLEALHHLKLKHRTATFHCTVIGSGPDTQEYEERGKKLLGGAFSLREDVTYEDLPQFFLGADIFCHPSRSESFGLVVIDSLVAGIATVACDCTALPELITNGRTGLLVPTDDPAALADALRSLIRNMKLREALATAAHAEVVNKFTWEKTAEGFERVYEEVRRVRT